MSAVRSGFQYSKYHTRLQLFWGLRGEEYPEAEHGDALRDGDDRERPRADRCGERACDEREESCGKRASFVELFCRGDVTSVERTCAETAKRSTARGQNISRGGSARVPRRQY